MSNAVPHAIVAGQVLADIAQVSTITPMPLFAGTGIENAAPGRDFSQAFLYPVHAI